MLSTILWTFFLYVRNKKAHYFHKHTNFPWPLFNPSSLPFIIFRQALTQKHSLFVLQRLIYDPVKDVAFWKYVVFLHSLPLTPFCKCKCTQNTLQRGNLIAARILANITDVFSCNTQLHQPRTKHSPPVKQHSFHGRRMSLPRWKAAASDRDTHCFFT